jgi:hypothetical protein
MVGERQGWSTAYHFHSDELLTITQAMKLRQGNDPRAGDLHCHRDCFVGNTGDRLLTRKEAYDGSRKAHFAKWPSVTGSSSTQLQCNRFSHATSKRESMDYAQYYFQFEEYLTGLIEKGEPYFISSVERGKGVGEPDFILGHGKNEWGLSKTFVTIIDENKRRNRRLKSYNQSNTVDGKNINIIIVISEYTVAQLHDFKRGGIDKFEIFWGNFIKGISDEITRMKNAENRRKESKQIVENWRRESELREEIRIDKLHIESEDRITKAILEIREKIDTIEFDEILPPKISTLLERLELEIKRIEEAQGNNQMTPELYDELIESSSKLQSIFYPEAKANPRKLKIWRFVGEYYWLINNFGLEFFESKFTLPENVRFVLGKILWKADPNFYVLFNDDWLGFHGEKVFIISNIIETIATANGLICKLWRESSELSSFIGDTLFNQKYPRHGGNLWGDLSICSSILRNHADFIPHSNAGGLVLKSDLVEFCKQMKLPFSGTKVQLTIRIIEHEKLTIATNASLRKKPLYLVAFLRSRGYYQPYIGYSYA